MRESRWSRGAEALELAALARVELLKRLLVVPMGDTKEDFWVFRPVPWDLRCVTSLVVSLGCCTSRNVAEKVT